MRTSRATRPTGVPARTAARIRLFIALGIIFYAEVLGLVGLALLV